MRARIAARIAGVLGIAVLGFAPGARAATTVLVLPEPGAAASLFAAAFALLALSRRRAR